MVRFQGRALKGNELRDVNREIQKNGQARELYKAVQRGDSASSLKKIFKNAGFNLNTGQIKQYVISNYKPSVGISYIDKTIEKFGKRSGISQEFLQGLGQDSTTRVIIKGKGKDGKDVFRTIDYTNNNLNRASDLVEFIQKDLQDLYGQEEAFKNGFEIERIDFY